jgi:hypothetical protein
LILKGCGKRYIGSHINVYFTGDLVLLGANLPHCWKTEDDATKNSVSVVIHFNIDFLVKDFFHKHEMSSVLQLVDNSKYGLQFTEDITKEKKLMLSLLNEKNAPKKLIFLLEILHELYSTRNYIILDKYTVLIQDFPKMINKGLIR